MKKNQKKIIRSRNPYLSMLFHPGMNTFMEVLQTFSNVATEISTEKIRLFCVGCRPDTDNQW